MNPTHRFVILCAGWPTASCATLDEVIAWLWGRDLAPDPQTGACWYTVLDYERPVRCDTPDLLAWARRQWPEAAEARAV